MSWDAGYPDPLEPQPQQSQSLLTQGQHHQQPWQDPHHVEIGLTESGDLPEKNERYYFFYMHLSLSGLSFSTFSFDKGPIPPPH